MRSVDTLCLDPFWRHDDEKGIKTNELVEMRTRRNSKRSRMNQNAGTKCTILTSKGVVCSSECKGDAKACGRHMKGFLRDNPSAKLPMTGTPTETAVMKVLNAMREAEGMKKVNNAFVELLVARKIFNPADNVNKFVTGGVAEDVITELIVNLGFETKNVAATETVIDIKVDIPDDAGAKQTVGISLKNSGSITQQPILENYRGESRADIRNLPPTLIVYTEVLAKRARIVYIDHDIIKLAYPDLTDAQFNTTVYNKKEEGDKQSSLSFRSGFLSGFIPRLPEAYVVTAVYPDVLPATESKSITLLALEYVRSAIEKGRRDGSGGP
jgi:hypothetical protein